MTLEIIETKAEVRILAPQDSDQLEENIPQDYLKTLYRVALYTGMRYVELQRLYEHPEWYQKNRRNIHLPKEAQKKVKRIAPMRNIHPIPPAIEGELAYFFKNKRPPTHKVWNENLKRWAIKAGLGAKGISAKTTRATIESWMVSAGIPIDTICLRQGHDRLTSMNHYQALAFTDSEKIEIKNRLVGII